jgi:hypothetical protein
MKLSFTTKLFEKPDHRKLVEMAGNVKGIMDVKKVIRKSTKITWKGRAPRFNADGIRKIATELEKGVNGPQYIKDKEEHTLGVNAARNFRMEHAKFNKY